MSHNVPGLPDVDRAVAKRHGLARDCESNRSDRGQCAVGRASPKAAGAAGEPVLCVAANYFKRGF